MQIYNEIVKDLLRPDSGPLRLLNDPEVCNFVRACAHTHTQTHMIKQKGTIMDKLDEGIAKDSQYLRHLRAICEDTATYNKDRLGKLH